MTRVHVSRRVIRVSVHAEQHACARNTASSSAKILVNLPFYESRTNCRSKRGATSIKTSLEIRPPAFSYTRALVFVCTCVCNARMCATCGSSAKNCSWLDTLLKIARQEFAATMSVEIARAYRAAGARYYEKGR